MERWMPIQKLYRMDSHDRIIGFALVRDGYYISDAGRLMAYGKIRSNKPDQSGYICDQLRDINGKAVRFKRHQIVMQTFSMLEYKENSTVDHKNRDKSDNRLENLRWATKKEQVANRENKEYKYKPVICTNDGRKFQSCQDAERHYGIAKNMVSRVARGERKSVHGYCFKYI